jgi:hypothetical protein
MTHQTDPSDDTLAFQPAPPEPEAGTFATPAGSAPTSPVPAAPVRARSHRMATWVNAALGLALAVAVAGIAFAAGRMTAPANAAANGGAGNGGGFGRGGNGYFPGGGFPGGNGNGNGFGRGGGGLGAAAGVTVEGIVESVSGDTLTLKTASGATIQIGLSGTTTYHSQASASPSDLKTGGNVIVRVDLRRPDGGEAGATGPTANDVTVVP